MTINEFFEELSKTKLRWNMTADGKVRACHGSHCPISAVTGDTADFIDAGEAGINELGLRKSVAWRVVDAADNPVQVTRTGREYRRRLLKACGLSEDV